jgi:outer membrane receptor protein involved in Fe transport
VSFTQAALTAAWYGFCGGVPCTTPQAPDGQMLPTTPRWKGDAIARYTFSVAELPAFVQAAYVYQSYSWEDMRTLQRELLGQQHPFGLLDLSVGIEKGRSRLGLIVTNVFDKREDLYRYSQCTETTCANPDIQGYAPHVYSVPGQPRTIGLKFGQQF